MFYTNVHDCLFWSVLNVWARKCELVKKIKSCDRVCVLKDYYCRVNVFINLRCENLHVDALQVRKIEVV